MNLHELLNSIEVVDKDTGDSINLLYHAGQDAIVLESDSKFLDSKSLKFKIKN